MKKAIFTIVFSLLIMSCNNTFKKNALQSSNISVIEAPVDHDTSKIKQIEYSLVISNRDSVFLYNQYEPGKPVTILNFESGYLFETTTDAYSKYESDFESDFEPKIITRIKDQPSKSITGESIAFFCKKPSDFVLLNKEEINNYTLSKSIDSLIKKSSLIDSLLFKNKCSEGEYNYSLEGILPSLIGLRYKDNQIIIATYEIFKGVIGPRLAIFNDNKVVPLTGQCSFKYLYYYSMFGKYYLYTGSGGCECGINATEIFEIKPDTISKTFQDYIFSD